MTNSLFFISFCLLSSYLSLPYPIWMCFSLRKLLLSFVLNDFLPQNTGSQESIIQLDLDDDDESDASPPDQRRRYSVSPMPQIRSSESQVRKRFRDKV